MMMAVLMIACGCGVAMACKISRAIGKNVKVSEILAVGQEPFDGCLGSCVMPVCVSIDISIVSKDFLRV